MTMSSLTKRGRWAEVLSILEDLPKHLKENVTLGICIDIFQVLIYEYLRFFQVFSLRQGVAVVSLWQLERVQTFQTMAASSLEFVLNLMAKDHLLVCNQRMC